MVTGPLAELLAGVSDLLGNVGDLVLELLAGLGL